MYGTSESKIPRGLRRSRPASAVLAALGVTAALSIAAAHGENLDQGKSATRLFADSCTACHRSARGLAKGRFRLTLFMFLQQHYVTNSTSAWELTSYLESVDGEKRGRSRAAAGKPPRPAGRMSGLPLRPPMPVPQH